MAVIALTLLCLAAMSLAADRAFAAHPRLPMRWNFRGRVTWSAPRRVALSFTPALAAGTLLLIALLPAASDAERDFALLFSAGCFIAVHLLHFWLARRWLA